MKIDGKAILNRLNAEKGDRKKISLYLSESIYGQFKKECVKQDLSASVVMEELLKEFLGSLKKG